MLYVITGTDSEGARALMAKALPIIGKRGAPTDVNTFVIPGTVGVVGPQGASLPSFGDVTFGFPAFDNLRAGDLKALADELAAALEVPCYTLNAPVVAGFPTW